MEQVRGEFSQGRQDVTFEGLYEVHGHAVRVTVTRDFYAFQSGAKAEMFDPIAHKWNTVAMIPWANMAAQAARHNGIPSPEEADATYYADASALLDKVGEVLAIAKTPTEAPC